MISQSYLGRAQLVTNITSVVKCVWKMPLFYMVPHMALRIVLEC